MINKQKDWFKKLIKKLIKCLNNCTLTNKNSDFIFNKLYLFEIKKFNQ